MLISKYNFTLTKTPHYDNLNKLADVSYRFECFFEDDKYQYKIIFNFEPFSYSASKAVFVNITKSNGSYVLENSDITVFSGGFNETVIFQNKLDEPVELVFGKFSVDSEWSRNPPQKIKIPANWKWSHFFVNFHTGDELDYDYVIKPGNIGGRVKLKGYPHCMTEDEVKSLYSQVGAYPKFPSYLPEGYSFECGVHNMNGYVHLVYFTDKLREKFDDRRNSAFNFDFIADGGIRIDYYNGYIINNFNDTPGDDRNERFQQIASQARATSYTIGDDPAVLVKEYFWRDGKQRSFNELKIFAEDEILYFIKSGLPESEVIKIAESLG